MSLNKNWNILKDYNSSETSNSKGFKIFGTCIIFIVAFVLFWHSLGYVISYRKNCKQINVLQEKINAPLNSSLESSGDAVYQILSQCPSIKQVAMVISLKLSDKGYTVDKEITLDDIAGLSDTLIEVDIVPSDVQAVLNYFSDKQLYYKTLTVDRDLITLIIQI